MKRCPRSCVCRHRAPCSLAGSSSQHAGHQAECEDSAPGKPQENQSKSVSETALACHRTLDDLILWRRHTERLLTAIGFGHVDSPHRLRLVATRVEPSAALQQILSEKRLTEVGEPPFEIIFLRVVATAHTSKQGLHVS